ncbi:MAG: hypothetical protein DRP78_06985 [Candidatus Omnitrophota bacterium]|nr:MAG: hypothetical protein DRP78_06985 [Candidatus Omnitrophota bacterium]
MNILITGATGFIGRNLVQELAKSSENKLICLVRSKIKAKRLDLYGVRCIYADITQLPELEEKMTENIDLIFHCAGYVSNKDKQKLDQVNVVGTENVCKLALKLKARKMVYLSSVAVISGNLQTPLTEDLPYKATNPYGESKIAAEKKVLQYRKLGLKAVILRPCMVYGEQEPHLLKTFIFLLKFRLMPLLNKGANKFHLVYVKNVIDAMIFSLHNDAFLKGTFFIADKEVLSNKQVMLIIAQAVNAPMPLSLPDFMTKILIQLPYVGRKFRFFIKDRVYSTKSIQRLSFKHKYPAQQSLSQSCKAILKAG